MSCMWRTDSSPSPLMVIVFVFILLPLLAFSQTLAADPESRPHSFGIGIHYLSPSSPLDGGAGPMLLYTRSFAFGKKKDSDEAAPDGAVQAGSRKRPYKFKGEIASFTLDREAGGVTAEGELDLLQLSLGLVRSVGSAGGNWSFALGAGVDYFSADAEGTFFSGGVVAVLNRYEADDGIGFHGEFDITADIGPRWQFLANLGYLVAELDGTHQFFIDGIPGTLDEVDFDLNGPQLDVGFAYKF